MKKLKPKRLKASPNIAPINQTYGELKEDLHLTGYAFERGQQRLHRLLSDEGWRLCAGSFSDVDAFLDSLQLDQFAKLTEEKREIADLIKELRPEVSTRAIARALKVDEGTLRKNSAGEAKKANQNSEEVRKNSARTISGAAAAKLVTRRERGKQARIERVNADEQRILTLAPVAGKFRTLLLDPAWDYEWLSLAGRAKPGYAMQTHEQLLALDVRQWADETTGVHLYLCFTNNFMTRACDLVKHWGFQHRTVITWVKDGAFGLGSYFRNSTEHILFATLGETTTRPAAASIPTHFFAPRGEHSEKPEALYNIIPAASYPPYGEGNQRETRPDFANLHCPATEREETEAAE